VRGFFVFHFIILALGATTAIAESWPAVETGKTLTIKNRKKLPAELKSIVQRLCRTETSSAEASVEFFGLPPNHQFVVVRCLFGVSWTANLFENGGKGLVHVSLPVGNPEAGFELESGFSSVDLDIKKQRLQVSFETDSCGEDGLNTFTYQFDRGRFKLMMVGNIDCEFKPVKIIWKARDFKE
jgi:hypothetical protein